MLIVHLFLLLFGLLRTAGADAGSGDPGGTSDSSTDTGDATEDDNEQDVTKLKEALRREREARRALDKEVKPLRTFKQQQEDAARTEAERLQTRQQAAEAKERELTARERRVELRDEVTRVIAAEKLTLQAPIADVLRLLDTDAVEWSDDGKPKNAATLIKALVKDRPYLVGSRGSIDGGERGGAARLPAFGSKGLKDAFAASEQRRR